MVRTVVKGYIILLAIEDELSLLYTVTETADESREERLSRIDIVIDVIMSLDYVGHVTVLVRNHDSCNSTTKVCYCNLCTVRVTEYVEICLLSLDGGHEVFTLQTTDVFACCHIKFIVKRLYNKMLIIKIP